MAELKPFYENVQAHYDLSNDFFALFLDPSMTYSCAYFERDDMTLAEAQLAKIDLSLVKCQLEPGQLLLDIGCGWGATVRRAAEKYQAHAVGLTLSREQHALVSKRLVDDPPTAGSAEVRLAGWEEFDEPVDRIVSIGAFEHFRRERYDDFFGRCRSLLPDDGRMLLHTILMYGWKTLESRGIQVSHENVKFAKFIRDVIFPGGELCEPDDVVSHAEQAGFVCERRHSLQKHYARTLDIWAENLKARRDDAIRIASQDMYDTYMYYLTGCAAHFKSQHIDVMQFTLRVA